MLITNYFQVRGATPLQTEVIETLKELNDQNAGNTVLQEQIRQLDLLSRKAYFIRLDHLMMGVYLLIGMLVVFIVSLRLYFAKVMNIPDKEIDPIDDWAIKSSARRYVMWGVSGASALALAFVVLSSPHLQSATTPAEEAGTEQIAQADAADEPILEAAPTEDTIAAPESDTAAIATTDTATAAATEEAPKPVISNVTHSAFRGNNGNGISAAKQVPVKWNLADGTNIAWKITAPRKGYNSPVIHGNHLLFSGADEQARELYCYDLTTGEKIWSLAATGITGSPTQLPKTTEDTGLAASTVATNGTQVCAIFATGDIICADMQGKRLWAKNLGLPDNHYGYASSLLIHGNVVFVQYDNQNSPKVVALDLATGAERWSKSRKEKATWSSPIIAGVGNARQLVLMGNPSIIAYNPTNGEQLWSVNCLSGEVGSSPCSANGVIYGASEYSKLIAINGADGKVLWEGNDFLPEVSSPVATKDNIYLATSYGMAVSYDTQTGALRKEHDLGVEFYSSPIIVEGKVYLISNSGKVHIFSANNEFTLLQSFETGEPTFATPAFTDGKIVVRTQQSIYCVSTNG